MEKGERTNMIREVSVTVRLAQQRDLGFCIQTDYKHLSEAMVKHKIDEKAVILAEVDGKPVGYIRVEYLWLHIPYLSLIWVNEKYRRRGVGTAMIKYLEERLLNHGYNVLYSSSQANEPASQAWHRNLGFEECGFIAGINPPEDVVEDPEATYVGTGGVGEIFFRKILKKSDNGVT